MVSQKVVTINSKLRIKNCPFPQQTQSRLPRDLRFAPNDPVKTASIEDLRKLLKAFFEKAGVKKAVVFGSHSRGSDTRKSDLDLVVVMDTEKRFFKRYDDLEEIYELLPDKTVDLLIYTPEEMKRIAHRGFIKKILEEGQTIYEH